MKTIIQVQQIWAQLANEPVDDNQQLERAFHHFEAGDSIIDVWLWIDGLCPDITVAQLQQVGRDDRFPEWHASYPLNAFAMQMIRVDGSGDTTDVGLLH